MFFFFCHSLKKYEDDLKFLLIDYILELGCYGVKTEKVKEDEFELFLTCQYRSGIGWNCDRSSKQCS